LPTVVVNQGGVGDLVIEGETGYTCPEDPFAFAEAVNMLRDNAALREQMAFKARMVAQQHPWEGIMSQLEGHYREAVELNQRFMEIYHPESGLNLSSWFQWGNKYDR
jgi:glycosyltransferase involved in cell wall biosynthesis